MRHYETIKPGQVIRGLPGETIVPMWGNGVIQQDVYLLMSELGDRLKCEPEFRMKTNTDEAAIHVPGWRIDFVPRELRGLNKIHEMAIRLECAIKESQSGWESKMPRMRLWREA